LGVPDCPNARPFSVEIRRSAGSRPDPTSVIASFTLSHDNDPLRTAFESVSIHQVLDPGTYFAMFSAAPGDIGFLLNSATDPFTYRAGLTDLGVLSSCCGASVSQQFAAVRILGTETAVPEPSSVLLVVSGILASLKRARNRNSPSRGHDDRAPS
jgi:hypothetical protein